MPTVHRDGPYRFFFYSADRHEPPHVQVERDAKRAKFWLGPVRRQGKPKRRYAVGLKAGGLADPALVWIRLGNCTTNEKCVTP